MEDFHRIIMPSYRRQKVDSNSVIPEGVNTSEVFTFTNIGKAQIAK